MNPYKMAPLSIEKRINELKAIVTREESSSVPNWDLWETAHKRIERLKETGFEYPALPLYLDGYEVGGEFIDGSRIWNMDNPCAETVHGIHISKIEDENITHRP